MVFVQEQFGNETMSTFEFKNKLRLSAIVSIMQRFHEAVQGAGIRNLPWLPCNTKKLDSKVSELCLCSACLPVLSEKQIQFITWCATSQ